MVGVVVSGCNWCVLWVDVMPSVGDMCNRHMHSGDKTCQLEQQSSCRPMTIRQQVLRILVLYFSKFLSVHKLLPT